MLVRQKTIAAYKKNDLICFGWGDNHAWSKRQDDGSYVITCPNKDKAGIQAVAHQNL